MRLSNIPFIGIPFLAVETYQQRSEVNEIDTTTLDGCNRKIKQIKQFQNGEDDTAGIRIHQTMICLFFTAVFYCPPLLVGATALSLAQFGFTIWVIKSQNKAIYHIEKKAVEIFKEKLKTFSKEYVQVFKSNETELYDPKLHLYTLEKRVSIAQPLFLIVEDLIHKILPSCKDIFGHSASINYPHLYWKEKGEFGDFETNRYRKLFLAADITAAAYGWMQIDFNNLSEHSKELEDLQKRIKYMDDLQQSLKETRLQKEIELFINDVDLDVKKPR
ncbi:MAG: hypothetical protein H0W88_07920 [Parachlamydiaceae bacterium]|nr:hypothetical protein [Parachlamydiaceae bacterium]